MATNWTKIYTTSNPIEAEIVLSMLRENDIEAVEMNKRDSSYLAFGTVELYCPSEKVIAALQLINNTEAF